MKRIFTTAVFAGIVWLAAAQVQAQTGGQPMQRPTGLFGPSRAQLPRSLDLTISSFVADDSNLSDTAASSGTGAGTDNQTFAGLTFGLSYVRHLRRVSFGLAEMSAVRYYSDLSNVVPLQNGIGGGLGIQLEKTRINVSQTAAYVPYYSFTTLPSLFSGELVDMPSQSAFDQVITRREAWIASSSGSIVHSFGKRFELTGTGSYQQASFNSESTGLVNRTLMGRLSYGVTKELSLVGGLSYNDALYKQFENARPTVMRNIDAGVRYDRPLSISRRTTLSFSTGTSALEDQTRTTFYYFSADARINREIGRSWHATGAYHRGVNFVPGFATPFFADAFSTNIGGSVTRRSDFIAEGGYSRGELGAGVTATDTQSYYASARFRVGFSQSAAFTAQYLYYRYEFADGVALPTAVPLNLDRNGIRVGIDFWLPLFR